MKKRTKIIGLIAIVLIALTAVFFIKEATGFKDPSMKSALEKRKSGKASKSYLKEMKDFYTSTLSNYYTLADLKDCRKLEKLGVNVEVDRDFIEMWANKDSLTEEQNAQFNKEIAEVVRNNENLSKFIASNELGNLGEWNWDFLSEGKSIEYLCFKSVELKDLSFISKMDKLNMLVFMRDCKGIDFSQLEECNNFRILELNQMDIQTADQLKDLYSVDTIWLVDCPICENEAEMEKLRELLPYTEIKRSGYELNDVLLEADDFNKYEE